MLVLTEHAPPDGRWSDLPLRAVSAVALAPVVLACVWAGGLAWLGLVGVAAVVLSGEWVTLCRRLSPRRRPPVLAAGLAYFALVAWALLRLRADPAAGRAAVLFLMLVVWSSDIGAYAAGRLVGGPRLWPAVSPLKTWAGAAGGLLSAGLVGLGIAVSLGLPAGARPVMVACALSAAGQSGDLVESAIKRGFGVKNTSALIPGHGGLLDRLDALLAAAPVAAGMAILAGTGVVFFR